MATPSPMEAGREQIAAALLAVLKPQVSAPTPGQPQLGRPPPESEYRDIEKVREGLWRGFHTNEGVWKFIWHAEDGPPDESTPGWYAPKPGTVARLGVTPWQVRRTAQGTYEYFDSSKSGDAVHPDEDRQVWLTENQFREQAGIPLPVPDAPPGWWVKIVGDEQWVIRSAHAPSGGTELTGWLPAEEATKKIRSEESTVVELLADVIRMYPELGEVAPEKFEEALREKLGP
ncbi:hypothetical protein [Streptomyces sp. NPDC047028]|uniref:hypothetical protein n=1 Tax=Streptomyces sp. NPDC047028 TaxID=3155793 RepID=UPI0033FAE900